VQFKIELVIGDARLDTEDTFQIEDPSPPLRTLALRVIPDSDLRPDWEKGDCFCTVLVERTPSEKLHGLLASEAGKHEFITPDGDTRPEALKAFISDLRQDWFGFVQRVVRVMRWRRGAPGRHDPIRDWLSCEWSSDRKTWLLVPGARMFEAHPGLPYITAPEEIKRSVTELTLGGATEPFAHELFHEAESQRLNNPRSSLVCAIAAAEVGFKQFVGTLVPDAKWLVDNAPTPPLVNMLTEYLPNLPVRLKYKGQVVIPKSTIEVLRKGVLLRNKVAHAKAELRQDTLREVLGAARDLLYLLDYYSGHAWALDLIITPAAKQELETLTEKT